MRVIGKILTVLNRFLIFLQRRIYLLFLIRSKQKGLIDDYHFSIRRDWVNKPKQFGLWDYFYQTHPSLNINGVRPTITRLNNYKIFEYINQGSTILDIGCNTGFISAYLSEYVKAIDAVEFDKDVISIAHRTMEYLSINNVQLFNEDIKTFKSNKKYDLVMSYAIHRWVGIELIDYVRLLLSFKDASGFIIIESHPDESDKANLRSALKSLDLKNISNGLTDDHLGYIREFFIIC
jgi:SAM-dependent methyltransferase